LVGSVATKLKPGEPWLACFNGWDHYPIKCVVQENTVGTYTIVMTENGNEIERQTTLAGGRDMLKLLEDRSSQHLVVC
jgi:hypothetical protein